MKMIFNKLILVLFWLLYSFPLFAETEIRVSVLSLFKPRFIQIESEKNIWKIELLENKMQVNHKEEPFFQHSFGKSFTLEIPGKIKRQYPGKIEIYPHEKKLMIINTVPLSEYLQSVVISEMGSAEIEALKAQAILSRTVALKSIQDNDSGPYHLTDMTDSQVYKGKVKLNLKLKKAVLETDTLVLKFQEQLPQIFYSSTCGGKTTTPEWVWGKKEPGYVSVECALNHQSLCSGSPHFIWHWKVNLKELENIFKTSKLIRLSVVEKDSAGRAVIVSFTDESENTIKLTGIEFHRAIGKYFKNWGLLKSTLFEIRKEEDEVYFLGKGLGHGVGLCQYGAKKLAKQNFSCIEILKFYYPLFLVKSF